MPKCNFVPKPSALQNLYDFLNCLYFNFVTFITLGYGDLYPVGITNFFATVEVFTGALMLASFVVIVCHNQG